jgi:hypothetical protein
LAINTAVDFVNANTRGETPAERLQDIPARVQEIAIHGVHSGAGDALATAQLRHMVQLSDSLTPSFAEERADEGFDDLVEEFAACADAITDTSSAGDIINIVFL